MIELAKSIKDAITQNEIRKTFVKIFKDKSYSFTNDNDNTTLHLEVDDVKNMSVQEFSDELEYFFKYL